MRNEMIRKVLILLTLLVSQALSNSCVTYTFEDDFYDHFTDQGFCTNFRYFWEVGTYNSIDVTGHNERSSKFIMPTPFMSCVSSFTFPMAAGGTIEVNIYMETTNIFDSIYVAAYQLNVPHDIFLAEAHNMVGESSFVTGWHTLKMTLPFIGTDIGEGYISIVGSGSRSTIVLVDSFRYIPPGMEESACRLYEDEPEPTVPPTLEPTTPDPTTPEETTPDQTTPEETTPDPTTPEVTTPEPTTPEVTTPEPTTPEVTTPEPTTPEETTTDPTTPEVTTPDPTTPEVTTPDPTTPEETTPENNHRYLLTVETWVKTQISKTM